jgi:hypothetical protein
MWPPISVTFFPLILEILFVFVLGLYFTYERKFVAFSFLNLDSFTLDDVLQFHPFTFFIAE